MPDKTSAVTYSSQSRHSSRVFAKNLYGKVHNSCEKRLFYKVKAVFKEMIHGFFGEAYSLLPRYAEMVKETNPGSYALVTWTQLFANVQPRFKACFFSFAAQVRGFLRGCRPIIGIDGAHLSGYYKGIMLTAVGIDGNNEIFVFAYGIVSTESVETWGYFMRNLKCLFQKEGRNRDDWTFISDRMKVVADAYNPYVFNKAMEKIHAYNPKVVDYLNSTTEVWSRHQFEPAICCDHNTTNFVESFNSCTKPYRDLPVLKLLEAIRQWSGELTEYATKILQTRSDESRFCYATPCGGNEFEVRDQHVYFPIKLGAGTCGCGKWQLSGIPCKHVLRVIYHQRLQAVDFVSPYFKGRAYKSTYAEHMHPMPDQTQWPSFNLPDILPPPVKRSAGRPKKQRRRGASEARKGKRHSTIKCSLCKELGHNMLTCAAKKQIAAAEATTAATKNNAEAEASTSRSKK
ncbi:uncharacterized protein LOC110738561 [Chenopodium quinoa]|uniref:uncharacterized protein LOC110738561 n=1 Tax=Chenopodium quinoa TaxID=63459 RepID=UPI000B78A610|nr:uncharacterized protein LOC110738561 [Chenopodium quinoa]